eukprot:g11183.t2
MQKISKPVLQRLHLCRIWSHPCASHRDSGQLQLGNVFGRLPKSDTEAGVPGRRNAAATHLQCIALGSESMWT